MPRVRHSNRLDELRAAGNSVLGQHSVAMHTVALATCGPSCFATQPIIVAMAEQLGRSVQPTSIFDPAPAQALQVLSAAACDGALLSRRCLGLQVGGGEAPTGPHRQVGSAS